MNDATRAAFEAVRLNNCPELQRLLAAGGVDVNAENREETLLYKAAFYGKIDFVRLLLRAGARVNARTSEHRCTALHVAASRSDSLDILAELLAAGADANARSELGHTPLMRVHSLSVAAFLLARPEIDLDARSSIGLSAAYYFRCFNNRIDIAVAIEAEMTRRRRWSAARSAWLGAVVRAGVARLR